ncbi:hypothetical protein ACQKQD_30005 [Methylobacterium sp. NPDC080182]|uniref:hypothetical protein n=1 Tax=Methylobacterium sp. NPDC080182 TaxID=3390590 RepID=UPI003D00655C
MSRYEALYLFSANGNHLSRALTASMSAFCMTAGNWHKDGTREHIVIESANLLIVLPSRAYGHADIWLKSHRGKWQHIFRWRDVDAGYRQPTFVGSAAILRRHSRSWPTTSATCALLYQTEVIRCAILFHVRSFALWRNRV